MFDLNQTTVRRPTVCRDGDDVPEPLRGAVVAIGNFDGLHLGHQQLIASAVAGARESGRPSAVMTFDPHPRTFFAPNVSHFRLTPEPVWLEVLSRLAVDAVFIRRFDAALAGTSARAFVLDLVGGEIGASALVVGPDFHFGRAREGTPAVLRQLAAEAGLSLTIAAAVEVGGVPVSSSRVREALAEGDIAAANSLLGYRWFVSGPVVHGEKRGRTLGYPTANMRMIPGCRLRYGIYAVRVALPSGAVHGGVASFGRRPTFDNGAPLLETYLLDVATDLYGQELRVEFLGWIRGEERFPSADELVVRMRGDEEEARAVISQASSGGPPSLIEAPAQSYTGRTG